MPRPRPLVGRVQRKATKYDRLLTNRTTKLNQRVQAFDQRAQPRRQHIATLQGQIATRAETRDNLVTDKANLIGQIHGSRFPKIHLIKRAKARWLQVRINSKNRQIERRTKRIARQERIIDRHMTKAAAHAGAIQLLEADRQALRAPLAQAPQPGGPQGEQPEQGGPAAPGGGRQPTPGRDRPDRDMSPEERSRVAAELRRIRENVRRRRAARAGGEQQGGETTAEQRLAAMQERARRRRAGEATE